MHAARCMHGKIVEHMAVPVQGSCGGVQRPWHAYYQVSADPVRRIVRRTTLRIVRRMH
jgi:hypothetical protein